MIDLLSRGLGLESPQGAGAQASLRTLTDPLQACWPGETIEPAPCDVLVVAAGWMGVVRRVADGRRQILSTLVPGDPITRRELYATRACDFTALSKVKMVNITEVNAQHDVSSAIKQADERIDSYIFDHVVRLGLLTSYERAGHFLLETYERLDRVGLVNMNQFLMPLSQEHLGELLGVSATHVNRTFRQLRQDGFVVTGPGWLRLLNRAELASRVHYTPTRMD